MTLPDPSGIDTSLLRAVAASEPDAVGAWYGLEWPVVHRLALGFLADVAEAQDLAQDAMLHLLDHLDPDRLPETYARWRTTVVANLCRDRLRRRKARERAETDLRAALPQRLPDPAEAAARGDLPALLARALGALPEREREAFVLRELEEQDTGDVAAAMGVAASTVRALVTLARRRLRALLGPRLAIPEGTHDAI